MLSAVLNVHLEVLERADINIATSRAVALMSINKPLEEREQIKQQVLSMLEKSHNLDKSTSLMTMIFSGTPSWWVASIFLFIN